MFGRTWLARVDDHPYLVVRDGSTLHVYAGLNEERAALVGRISFDPGAGGRHPTATADTGEGEQSTITRDTPREALEQAIRFLAASPRARAAHRVHAVADVIHGLHEVRDTQPPGS